MKNVFYLLLLCAAYLPCLVKAQTITIYRGGSALSPTYSTLTAALAASAKGDSLKISAHRYTEAGVTVKKGVVLQGTFTSTDSTILDAIASTSGWALAISAYYLDTVIIRDMVITNGFQGGIQGSGTLIVGGRTVIHHNGMKGTVAKSARGGGIFGGYNLIVCDKVRIINNSANWGGGIYTDYPLLVKDDVLIADNHAKGTSKYSDRSGMGGGLWASIFNIEGHTNIRDNIADSSGGGIASYEMSLGSGKDAIISPGVNIHKNKAIRGGGIYIYKNAGNVTITGCDIWKNQADTGAAIYAHLILTTTYPNLALYFNRIYNPTVVDKRQVELYARCISSTAGLPYFRTEGNWWGSSDTAGMVRTNPPAFVQLSQWAVADWTVNNGAPLTGLTTFPVEARFKMNTGASLPTGSFPALSANYTSTTGVFSPATSTITLGNLIGSSYLVPVGTTLFNVSAIADADTFKTTMSLTSGTGINTTSAAGNIKVYPTLATDHIMIAGAKQGTIACMFNITGQQVYSTTIEQALQQLYIDHLASGTYLLQLTGQDGEQQHMKIVKE